MSRCLAAIGALLLAGCDSDERGSGPDRPQATNFAAATACLADTFEGAELTHCTADPKLHRIAMVLGPAKGEPYRSFSTFASTEPARARRVAFAMNGGMYGEDGRPIGYYVEGGKRLHKLNRAKGPGNFHLLPNGVFFGNDTQWGVVESARFARLVKDRPQFGTQSGPMLLIGGKLHPRISQDGASRYVRNAVGVDRQGRAHFVISDEPLSFGKLARYFRDELKAPNALFLDGNVSSLWHPGAGRMDQAVLIGPLIVVENRAKADGEVSAP